MRASAYTPANDPHRHHRRRVRLRDVWRASPARWRRFPPVGFVRPCEPALADRPPAGPGWLHEVKHDGFRILARKQGERAQVWSRRGADFTHRFPAIVEAVRGLNVDRAPIDGEAVVLRNDGRSDFVALLTKRGGAQAMLVAFDLLRQEGEDLRLRPLEARREALKQLVAGVSGILFSEALAAEGAVVFAKGSASKASCRSGRAASTGAGRAATGSRPRTRISSGRDRVLSGLRTLRGARTGEWLLRRRRRLR